MAIWLLFPCLFAKLLKEKSYVYIWKKLIPYLIDRLKQMVANS